MKPRTFTIAAAVTAALSASAVPVQAQSSRTFVSGQGVDSGTCTLAAPCRSFAYALTQTSVEGEIAVLNTAGYGNVTISHSLSIVNPGGVEAGISVGAGGTAITVAAGEYDSVNLRGLTIEGSGVGANGILMTGGGKLDVLDCDIRDMTQKGIAIEPNADDATVVIADTTIANNASGLYATGGNYGDGLHINLSHVKVINNGSPNLPNTYGIQLIGAQNAVLQTTIESSLISGNGTGLAISTPATPNLVVAIFNNSNVIGNGSSLNIGHLTAVTLEKTMVGDDSTGTNLNTEAIINNGTLYSYGDNAILDTLTGNPITSVSLR